MGKNIAMLDEQEAAPGLHHGHCTTIELEECIHFHHDEFRFMWTTEEFLRIADAVAKAKSRVVELGSPEQLQQMLMLGQDHHPDVERKHEKRNAVELVSNKTIHFHHKNSRIHMTRPDFYELADMVRNAMLTLAEECKVDVDITADHVKYPSHCDKYIKMLDEYTNGDYPEVSAYTVVELRAKIKHHLCHPNGDSSEALQRDEGNLPTNFPGTVPEDLDRQYLYALFESIKKWGYAGGPFYRDYMPAYKFKDGTIRLKGAHRAAVLKYLKYTTIPVMLTEPNTDWEEWNGSL